MRISAIVYVPCMTSANYPLLTIIHVNHQIGNGVFLAAGSIIMGNIIVGDGAVIDAGSVVTKPVRPYTRVGDRKSVV